MLIEGCLTGFDNKCDELKWKRISKKDPDPSKGLLEIILQSLAHLNELCCFHST